MDVEVAVESDKVVFDDEDEVWGAKLCALAGETAMLVAEL